MTIQLLDELLINKIAAGEVVERPSSVVKELVENSIDANSTIINIKTEAGGLKSITVSDNGTGIPPEELELAFMRHATSKITSENDLFNVHTMGFRGEALPSIASISRIEITTGHKPPAAAKAIFEAGKKLSLTPAPFTQGTLLVVKDLFYNTPARLKYQKSAISENMHIYDTILRLAISRPDVSFSFANDKRKYFHTPGDGVLTNTLLSIYGPDYINQLIPIEYKGEHLQLYGLISRPEYKKMNRSSQFYYINKRSVFNPMIASAVEQAYRGFLLSREFPVVILFLELDYAKVDINVHPQKQQVRIMEGQSVFSVISHTLRKSLEALNYRGSFPSPMSNRHSIPAAKLTDLTLTGGAQTFLHTDLFKHNAPVESKEINYNPAEKQQVDAQTGEIREELLPANDFIIIGQAFNAYIIVERGDKLWLVDQHAAHERINYIRNRERLKQTDYQSQPLIMPVTVSLSNADIELLENNKPLWQKLGFVFDRLTPGSIVIRAIPSYAQGSEQALLLRIIELIKAKRIDELQEQVIITAACKQSIKAGELMSNQEMYQLIGDLIQVENFWHCPHGRPTIIEMSRSDLDRKFKR